MSNLKIAVIIPIYRTEKFLRKCLDSIVNQTYANLEIILVDDGSPDNCPRICDEYAARDSRIHVVHKTNGGLSSARNAGIEASAAEYLTFIDSDDYIEPNMFAKIAEAIEQQAVDLVFIREKSVNIQGRTIHINGGAESGKIIFGGKQEAAKIIVGMQCNGMCDKTYRRSIIEELRVVENRKHGEDLFFNLQYLCRVRSMALVDQILYSYVSHEESMTHEGFNDHTLDEFFFKDRAVELLRKEFPQYTGVAERRAFVARQNVLRLLWQEHLLEKEAILLQRLRQYLNDSYPAVAAFLSTKEKMEYFLFQKMNPLYGIYLAIIRKIKKTRGV